MKVKKYNLMKKTPAEYVLYSIVFLIFCFFSASYLYMVFWCFYSGTRAPDIVVTDPFGFSKPNFKNYIDVFELMEANGSGFLQMLANSLYFSIFGCAIAIMVTTMFAYVCCKYRFPGSKLIYMIIIVITTLPIYGSGSGMYRLLFNIGLLNSPLMLITSIGGFNMNFLYIYAFSRVCLGTTRRRRKSTVQTIGKSSLRLCSRKRLLWLDRCTFSLGLPSGTRTARHLSTCRKCPRLPSVSISLKCK